MLNYNRLNSVLLKYIQNTTKDTADSLMPCTNSPHYTHMMIYSTTTYQSRRFLHFIAQIVIRHDSFFNLTQYSLNLIPQFS